MDDLAELAAYLTARYDEAEAEARNLLQIAQDVRVELADRSLLGRRVPGWHSWPDVEAMCTGRLADIALKRAILALHAEDPPGGFTRNPGDCRECSCDGALAATDCFYTVDYPCPTVRQLGTEFSKRPDYQDRWKPEA